MARVYVGLGSNIDPERNLRVGVAELRERFGALTLSPTYQSASVGFDGDDFLNLVVGFDSELAPTKIVAQLEDIHQVAGRVRAEEKFLSRTLDIDLLLVDDLVIDGPPTRLPRTDVLDCAFVLKPMVDIAPDLVHPETGETLAAHWAQFDRQSQALSPYELDLDISGTD
jgi:2-amino-4-hydroxy-6-hydroxymethyldihydropteridine diphosphokinase